MDFVAEAVKHDLLFLSRSGLVVPVQRSFVTDNVVFRSLHQHEWVVEFRCVTLQVLDRVKQVDNTFDANNRDRFPAHQGLPDITTSLTHSVYSDSALHSEGFENVFQSVRLVLPGLIDLEVLCHIKERSREDDTLKLQVGIVQ